MIICLSSGSTERYRQDVLRALALPIGSNLQFRYDRRWIADETMRMIEHGCLVGQDALIAYVDQSSAEESVDGQYISVVPVRIGSVSDTVVTGATVALEFTVSTTAHAADLTGFNQELADLSGGALPRWAEHKPVGKYCAQLKGEPQKLDRTNGIEQWQDTVSQLAEHDEFKEESAFVTVLGLLSESEYRKQGVNLAHSEWKQEVSPSSDYELLLYHFHVQSPTSDVTLKAGAGEGLQLDSRPVVNVDSRYDLKRFHIRSQDPPLARATWISIALERAGAIQVDVEMTTKVKSDFAKRLLTGAAIAIGLALAQVVSILASDHGDDLKALAIVLVGLGSLIVGMAAAFGLRRSF